MLAASLKRSLISVQKQLRKLGIGRRKTSEWTAAQIKWLRANYRETATWEIANRMNKSPSEIKRKARELGLKKR